MIGSRSSLSPPNTRLIHRIHPIRRTRPARRIRRVRLALGKLASDATVVGALAGPP